MPKSTDAAVGVVELFDDVDPDLADLLDHHLGDAVSPFECHRFLTQVDKGDLDFSPIVGVYGSRRIDNS